MFYMNDNMFIDSLKRAINYTRTENGAIAHKSTLNAVYDLFAFGGAYRNRTDEECIALFKKAYTEDAELALKCLFYLRDIRGGQGERRFFRVCFKWLAEHDLEAAFRNLDNIAEYGRWDDLYALVGTEIEKDALDVMKAQLTKDIVSLRTGETEGVSLLGKWLKSENTHSEESKKLGNITRQAFGMTHKDYRKTLSALRTRINIVEKLMSEGKWEDIDFAKLPSKAGFIYRNAFAHRDIIADKYAEFIANKNTKVNAGTLYPYELVHQIYSRDNNEEVVNKYWDNLPDYIKNKDSKLLCVVDVSGSMTCNIGATNYRAIDASIGLGLYCAERLTGAFKDTFITFSARPCLEQLVGDTLGARIREMSNADWGYNTNLESVFNLLFDIIQRNNIPAEDIPTSIVIISDMEIDEGLDQNSYRMETTMERIRNQWATAGIKMPKLVYWNVMARHNNILDETDNKNITYVSGFSPVLFEAITAGKSGIDIMLDKLNSARYANVK